MACIFTGHFVMLDKKYKVRESIDIYVIEQEYNSSELVKVQFYKINTREKITIEIDRNFTKILKLMDGTSSLNEIIQSLNLTVTQNELVNLIEFLQDRGLIKQINPFNRLKTDEIERYTRQINYFDNLISSHEGDVSQYELLQKKVVVFGVGATGGIIAAQLVRAGIKSLTLIDPKVVDESHISRHIYVDKNNIGMPKVDALACYLRKINSQCSVLTYKQKLLPETQLSALIDDDVNLVVNTADEPYIGHISLKLGRYLWNKKIALYVSGGFDAHLMSTGELMYKGVTPCPDCCSNTFRKALANWKPKYNSSVISTPKVDTNTTETSLSLYSGGIFSQSLYSASFAVMNIIDHLLDNNSMNDKLNQRGEYLVNQGKTTWFEMKSQEGCIFCGI